MQQGYKDSNLEMTESESVALPFGDSPLFCYLMNYTRSISILQYPNSKKMKFLQKIYDPKAICRVFAAYGPANRKPSQAAGRSPGRSVGYLSSSHMAAVLLAGSAGTVSLPLSTSS